MQEESGRNEGSAILEGYVRAQQFLPKNVEKMLYGTEIEPHWVGQGDGFWYKNETPDGVKFLLVDPIAGSVTEAGDRKEQATGAATENAQDAPEVLSPDKKYAAFVRDYNVYVRIVDSGQEIQLTSDGEEKYGYAKSPTSPLATAGLLPPEAVAAMGKPIIHWAPDSRKFLTFRLDNRKVGECYLVQSVPLDGSKRPLLHKYPYAQPGDENVPLVSPVVIDVETKKIVRAKTAPMMDIYYAGMRTWVYWAQKPSPRVYFVEATRMYKSAKVHMINPETGETRCLFEDTAPPTGDQFHIAVVGDAQEILWVSQKDNWAHIYRYNGLTGELINQVTSGPWVVRGIKRVDAENGTVYFEAGGKEPGRDPYYRHLYSVKLDGSNLRLLTPEDAEHQVTMSPSGKYFVDSFSRVDLPPSHVLRDFQGELVLDLGKADISRLLEAGWKPPERFCVKARDGVTDIYGIVIRPSNFDPQKSYPVVEANYSGPQTIRTPKAFGSGAGSSRFWYDQALAELGFVVVTVDGLGMAFRSKSFQDFTYKNLGDAGLDDHIIAFKKLAQKYPYMDLDRVGIYGGSAGGYASTRAILAKPDFYKVAVSWAGNHDHRTDKAAWNERYMGEMGPHYEEQSNAYWAKNLKGKLLIMHGDMDENVPPASSVQLLDALIKANKDFDYVVLPNAPHAYGMHPYIIRKRWDYFVKHLLGKEPPKEFSGLLWN